MTTLLRKPAALAAAVAAAAALAFGILCAAPAAAMADDGDLVAADGAALSAQQELSTQATVSIPVITKMTSKTTMYVYPKGEETVTETFAIKYNKNGQILSHKDSTKSSEGTAWENVAYTYNAKGAFVSSKVSNYEGGANTRKYALDAKGRVKKITYVDSESSAAYKYNSNGYVAKVTSVNNKFTWNSKGQLQKIVNSSGNEYGYTYDSKGNVAERTYIPSWMKTVNNTFTYENTYSGNLLKKRVETDKNGDVGFTTTFEYTTLKVPKAYANQVKAQQKWLKLNHMTYGFYNPPLEAMYK